MIVGDVSLSRHSRLAFMWGAAACSAARRPRIGPFSLSSIICSPAEHLTTTQTIAASTVSLCLLQQKEQDASSKHSKQHLLLGTHTSEGEQNYLMRAEVTLPLEEDEHNDAGFDEERGEVQC